MCVSLPIIDITMDKSVDRDDIASVLAHMDRSKKERRRRVRINPVRCLHLSYRF